MILKVWSLNPALIVLTQNCLIATGPPVTGGSSSGNNRASFVYIAAKASGLGVLNAFSHRAFSASISERRSPAIALNVKKLAHATIATENGRFRIIDISLGRSGRKLSSIDGTSEQTHRQANAPLVRSYVAVQASPPSTHRTGRGWGVIRRVCCLCRKRHSPNMGIICRPFSLASWVIEGILLFTLCTSGIALTFGVVPFLLRRFLSSRRGSH